MNLLLDTQVFLWMHLRSNLLGPQARRLLVHPDSTRWISVASLWEIVIKSSNMKLALPGPPRKWVLEHLSLSAATTLAISAGHALQVAELPFPTVRHRDPFDRLLVAQAQVEGLTLLTADARLAAYDVPVLMATE
jgi:PIN domain nuclease of toxin-antitoxin system